LNRSFSDLLTDLLVMPPGNSYIKTATMLEDISDARTS